MTRAIYNCVALNDAVGIIITFQDYDTFDCDRPESGLLTESVTRASFWYSFEIVHKIKVLDSSMESPNNRSVRSLNFRVANFILSSVTSSLTNSLK